METPQNITLYKVFKEEGRHRQYRRGDLSKIGREVAAVYRQIFGSSAPKEKVFVGTQKIWLSQYPADFRPIISNCITDFYKRKA